VFRLLGAVFAVFLAPLVPSTARAGQIPETEYLQSLDAQGWKTTPGGVRYRVLHQGPGKGRGPVLTDYATMHYQGRLLNGMVFDDTAKIGKPSRIQLTRVIAGWKEVVPQMRVGDRWEIAVPAALGYGARGSASGKIPPNATLLFTIELLGLEAPKLSSEIGGGG
jgi:FKBP-type peptidyl-prolyl cis-trans isomerase